MGKCKHLITIKKALTKNIQKIERLIESSNRKEDFQYALEVMKVYFYTRDKIEDLLPKVFKM